MQCQGIHALWREAENSETEKSTQCRDIACVAKGERVARAQKTSMHSHLPPGHNCSATSLLLTLGLLLSWRCTFRLGLWHLTRILRFVLDVKRSTWEEVRLSVLEAMANIQVREVSCFADGDCP